MTCINFSNTTLCLLLKAIENHSLEKITLTIKDQLMEKYGSFLLTKTR